jgi:triosephosphate isomerase (TIM)
MTKLIAGNWKMNTTRAEAKALAQALAGRLATKSEKFDLVICPPVIWLADVIAACQGSAVSVGAQDCHAKEKGAYTGNISAAMLKDIGARYVIVGHSERRQLHGETNQDVKAKAEKAIENGLIPIICVGEVEDERNAGKQNAVVGFQLAESLPDISDYVIAYEPVWAIGTGKTATAGDVLAMHGFIRDELAKRVDRPEAVAILYGGSVKAANAPEILATPNVDGVLVGGASLQPDEFWAIAQAS